MLPHLFANGRSAMLAGLCAIGLLSAAAGIGVAYGVAELFATVLDDQKSLDSAFEWFALLPAAALLLFGLQVAERVLSEHLGQHYVVELRTAIFDRLYALGDGERVRLRNGHLMTRFTADLTAIRAWVARGAAGLLTGSAMLLGLIAYLSSRHLLFGLTVAALATLLIATVALLGPALSSRILDARRRRARLSAFMGERVTAMQGVRGLRAGAPDRKRLGRLSRRLAHAMVVREGWAESARALPTASGLLAPALCVITAGMLPGERLGVAELILVMTVAGLIARPLTQLSQAFVHRSNFRVAQRMLLSLFRLPVQPTRRSGGRRLRAGATEIDARRLSIADSSEPLSAHAAPGARIVVSGPPGSGKSRLLRLLAGFGRVGRRRVRINGRDIATVARESLHREVRLLSSDMPLLKGSLYRNLGLRGSQRKQLIPLLERCGIVPALIEKDAVDAFRISEGGRNIGDSLRHRLLLARAIAGQPGLLLIDNFDQIHDSAIRVQIESLWADAPDLSIVVVSESATLRETADDTWYLHYRKQDGNTVMPIQTVKEAINDAA